MTEILAVDYESGKALFRVRDDLNVIVDINKRDVEKTCDPQEALTAAGWLKVARDMPYPPVWRELADAAVSALEVQETPTTPQAERKFRVPFAVKQEAAQAVDWVHGFERGSSTIGLAVAHTLSTENFITFSKLQRIARYFARRPQSITENAGWNPGEQGFPANDRIRYSLWGGEPAREWVAKVNKTHPLTADAGPPTEGLEEAKLEAASAPDAPDGDIDVDGNQPHEYVDDPDIPGSCLVCGREADDEIHTGFVASAFEVDPSCDYFGKGIDPDTTEVEDLYMRRPDGVWAHRVDNNWEEMQEPAEDEILIMLDEDSANKLAGILDDGDGTELPYELALINPAEAALFHAAEAEIDWEFIDRVFDIYDSQERSVNAKRQVRGPGGKFGDNPDDPDAKKQTPKPTKARLASPLPVVPNVAERINRYLSDVAKKRASSSESNPNEVEPDGDPDDTVTAAAGELADGDPGTVTDVRPLYLAIVDPVDTEAVLDLISLVPPAAGAQGDVTAWKRDNGTWVQAPDLLAELRGTAPPPVVELADDDMLQSVVDQVDAATKPGANPNQAEPGAPTPSPQTAPNPAANPDQNGKPAAAASARGYALPDGSFTIFTVEDLRTAVNEFGTARNETLARQHIIKRARALNRLDLLPKDWDRNEYETGYSMWGPHGEIISLVAAEGGADQNRGNAEKLRRYWVHGEGAAKIGWNTPGDWYRCVSHLSKYLGTRAKGYCTLRHRDATGFWPGQEPSAGGGK